MPSPLPQPPTLPTPSCPLALPHKLFLSCKLYELQGKEYLQPFSANNLPPRPTHLDSVKLELILAGKVLFPQDRGRARHMLSGGTPASRRKGLIKGSGGAFSVLSSKLTQIHSFLGKSKWKLGESRCHTMKELPSLGRKQQVLGRNVPPFVIWSAAFFSFERIAWNYPKDDDLSRGFVWANFFMSESRIQIHFSKSELMLLLLGRKNNRRKGTFAQRSWDRCRLFRIAEMKRAKAGRGAKLGWGIGVVFSNMRGHFRRAQGGQRTHVREGSPGHGQPEARPHAQKGSCSSIPASFCHTEYESRVAGLPYFSWEAEDTDSWEMSQFLNMATSFPFESLTKHGGRLNLPRAHQVALLACPRDILMKYFTQIATFLLYSIPVM